MRLRVCPACCNIRGREVPGAGGGGYPEDLRGLEPRFRVLVSFGVSLCVAMKGCRFHAIVLPVSN